MHRLVLLAAAAATVPALAHGGAPGTIVASDFAFTNPATGATTITIARGETVTFTYPAGNEFHNVVFTGPGPSGCDPGLPGRPARAPWTATCTFAAVDEYDFVCDFHPEMVGRVIVAAPAPAPAPTASPTPTSTPLPGGSTPTRPPPPPPAGTTPDQSSDGPAATRPAVARRQRGRAVRGAITIARPGSRLTVTLRARGRRLGRTSKTAAAGRASFRVRLNAAGRRSLRRGRLALAVRISVRPPSGPAFTATRKVTLRR